MVKQGPNLVGSHIINSGQTLEIRPPFIPIPRTMISDVYWYAVKTTDNSTIVPVNLVCKRHNSDMTLLTVFHNPTGYEANLYIYLTYDYL